MATAAKTAATHITKVEGDISDGKRVEAPIEHDRALHLKSHMRSAP